MFIERVGNKCPTKSVIARIKHLIVYPLTPLGSPGVWYDSFASRPSCCPPLGLGKLLVRPGGGDLVASSEGEEGGGGKVQVGLGTLEYYKHTSGGVEAKR